MSDPPFEANRGFKIAGGFAWGPQALLLNRRETRRASTEQRGAAQPGKGGCARRTSFVRRAHPPAIFFRPCFFSEAKKAKERFKVVVVGGGSDRWASRTSVYPKILKGYVAFVNRLVPG